MIREKRTRTIIYHHLSVWPLTYFYFQPHMSGIPEDAVFCGFSSKSFHCGNYFPYLREWNFTSTSLLWHMLTNRGRPLHCAEATGACTRKWKSGCITSCICPRLWTEYMHDTHAHTHHPALCRRQAFWLMWSANTLPPPFKGLQSLPHTHFLHLHCKKVECVKCACGHRGGAGYAAAAQTQISALLGPLVCNGRNWRHATHYCEDWNEGKLAHPWSSSSLIYSGLAENYRQNSCNCEIWNGEQLYLTKTLHGFNF